MHLSVRLEVSMRYSTQIKPIGYLKSHTAELLDRITEEREPIIITQNGEARAVLMDVHSYDEMQGTLALLQILAIADKEIERGETYALCDVAKDIGARRPRRGSVKSAVLSAAVYERRTRGKKS